MAGPVNGPESLLNQQRLALRRSRRTSFRLRNPKNTPPDWATQFVVVRIDEPVYLAGGRKLGALLPIRLEVARLMCHGPP